MIGGIKEVGISLFLNIYTVCIKKGNNTFPNNIVDMDNLSTKLSSKDSGLVARLAILRNM